MDLHQFMRLRILLFQRLGVHGKIKNYSVLIFSGTLGLIDAYKERLCLAQRVKQGLILGLGSYDLYDICRQLGIIRPLSGLGCHWSL